MASSLLTDAAEKALKLVEDSQGFHDGLVAVADARWKAFEGVLERNSDAAQWQSQAHPPYLNHIVETTVAGLMEDRFAFQVKPSPRFYNPGEFEKAVAGAKAHEDLFRAQLKADRFNEFQRPYILDAAVVGVGVAKTFWKNEVAPKKRLVERDIREIDDRYSGLPVAVPTLVEEERVETVFDGPVTESIDLRDVYWHEAAVSVEKSRFFAHAIWNSRDDLQKLAKAGKYDQAAVDQLKSATSEGQQDERERNRESRGRNKDMVECLEIWNRETGRVITIGARKVVLRDSPWPFWHRQFPFVFSSIQPYPRSLRGMSIVEKLMHLQEAAWDLMNQRIDSVRFINNFITILKSDVDDPDAFPFEPGAQWFMDDPTSAVQWQPHGLPPDSLQAENQMIQAMQNLAGGQPFTSTSEASSIGANTATEAALVTNLAQATVKQMKMQAFYSYERIGCQRMYLNQQFIREPVYILGQLGIDSQQEVREVLPFLLQGDYQFDVTPMSESLNRQERLAEANSTLQTAVAAQAVAAASGSPFNMREIQLDWLRSLGKENAEAYISAQPVATPGANPAQGAPPEQAAAGMTAQQSIDPANSPSVQGALAGATPMARQLSSGGGVSNT